MSVPCFHHAVKPGVTCQSSAFLSGSSSALTCGFCPSTAQVDLLPELYRKHFRFMLFTCFVCSPDVRLIYCREQMKAAKVRCSHVVAFN